MFPTQFTSASFTWERKKLGDVANSYINGGTPDTQNKNYWIGDIPWIQSSDLKNDDIWNVNINKYITNKAVNDSAAKLIPANSIAIVTRVGVGKLAYMSQEYSTSQDFLSLVDIKEDLIFIMYMLYFKISKVSSSLQGTSIKGITKKELLNLSISIVNNTAEQNRIGQVFKILDNSINLHEDYLQLLYDFRSFLLQKMFSINDTFPNLRFKQFNDKWKYKKLGEVADIVSGGTPDTTKHDYWNGSINWYTPAEVGNKIFVSDSQRKITNIGLENSSAKILPVGTVLFTSRAGIGKTAILKEKGSTNQGFQSIVPKQEFLDSYFIFSMSNILKKYGESHGAGSTFLEISGKELAKARISLPSITEQKNISKVLFKLDTIITLQKQEIDNLKKLKQFLLQNMFI
ncbi:restriction endonuclease subunit S [Ligilactobacillus salivarius]|uniref:restriction endonuclease subunit S n=1 Tax=Ligilactobacillus salivarius TaxID=1624 RepID=UPI000B95D328|nr:restriction endonuclease subunit S [Ligilactobacillus salivarius]OYP91856.1 restriction endonuclease subunit S [Ligilactobacillus salivarius]